MPTESFKTRSLASRISANKKRWKTPKQWCLPVYLETSCPSLATTFCVPYYLPWSTISIFKPLRLNWPRRVLFCHLSHLPGPLATMPPSPTVFQSLLNPQYLCQLYIYNTPLTLMSCLPPRSITSIWQRISWGWPLVFGKMPIPCNANWMISQSAALTVRPLFPLYYPATSLIETVLPQLSLISQQLSIIHFVCCQHKHPRGLRLIRKMRLYSQISSSSGDQQSYVSFLISEYIENCFF